jgi:transcriptional regulator with XRE-family HTH domain
MAGLDDMVKKQSGKSPTQRSQNTRSPDPRDREVGQRIRAQRLICSMSQEELGDRLGITFQQVQKYEKGTNRVAAGRLIRISEILGVPVGFFLDSGAKPGADGHDGASEALSFLKTAGAVRLLRAYATIETSGVRQSLVELAEQIAGREQSSASAGRRSASAARTRR